MSSEEPAPDGRLVLGRYRVVQPLARGGMGMVYLGRIEGAAGFAKPVVIKQVLSHMDSHESRAGFAREARLLADLQHPGIVGVLDFGEDAESYVMVLEYVHGYHLGQWLKYCVLSQGGMAWDYAVYIAIKVLDAVHYAHTRKTKEGESREIIHRDISPGNVLIDLQGNVRLVDFGIARAAGEASEFETKDGVVKGKLSYIAPEVYGSTEAGVSSDVYAVGVVLYQMLTGKNPFVGKHMSETIGLVLKSVPPSVHTLRADVSPELSAIIDKSIKKKPEQRYKSAQELANALRGVLGRYESEVAEEFSATIAGDFSGDLPDVLELTPLSQLDTAWRNSGKYPDSERSLLRSSLPPELQSESSKITIPKHDDLTSDDLLTSRDLDFGSEVNAALARESSQRSRGGFDSQVTTRPPPLIPAPTPTGAGAPERKETEKEPSRKGPNSLLTILGAGAVAAAVAGGVIYFTQAREPERKEKRFLLVERGGNTATPATAEGPAAPAPAPEPESTRPGDGALPPPSPDPAPQAEPAKSVAGPKTGGTPKNPLQELTSAFAKRQGAVQSCFKANAGAVSGSPQITVTFQVAASGAVNSASLAPAAVAGTTLGQCILGVAKGTQFPPQETALGFSIPIMMRVVN